ncbi:hypothetical protein AN189_18120 [Loktanella sp. 3ANDIMAR09]|uniref:phage tail protein n=1 Tax=Loktanella sp. 3ANDIMAR09 TaxID=1225657 RepID=UPI0006F68DC6|nr:phage tail protein [Loktanella sp. 3ANDIMAR09]KQI66971.1 hypothetical protein AN189_18120 [Loktanella sp. 3ANDIMAR09]
MTTPPQVQDFPSQVPAKGQPKPIFNANFAAVFAWFQGNAPRLNESVAYIRQALSEVRATAYAGDLPDLTGMAGQLVRVSDDETGLQFVPGGFRDVGEVFEVMGKSAPRGALVLDRATVSRTEFARLWAHAQENELVDPAGAEATLFGPGDGSTTFDLPDFQDLFRRAAGSGRAVGSYEEGANKAHTHGASTNSAGSHSHSGTTDTHAHDHDLEQGRVFVSEATSGTVFGVLRDGGGSFGSDTSNDSHNHGFSTNSAGSHSHAVTVQSSGEDENRPNNVAVLVCIQT